MNDKTRRKRRPWVRVFSVGTQVIDTDHPNWGIGEVLSLPTSSDAVNVFPRGQIVQFGNGRRREYYPGFAKLTAADQRSNASVPSAQGIADTLPSA